MFIHFVVELILRQIFKKNCFWPPFFQDGRQTHKSRGVQNQYDINYILINNLELIPAFPYFFPYWPFFAPLLTGLYEVGVKSMANIIDSNFAAVKFQRKKRIKPLGAALSGMKITDVVCTVEPEMLFRRISFTKKSHELFKHNFDYELAPYPVFIFDESGMRKTKKSMMYELFSPLSDTRIDEETLYVIDGGFLLHRVVWQKGVI